MVPRSAVCRYSCWRWHSVSTSNKFQPKKLFFSLAVTAICWSNVGLHPPSYRQPCIWFCSRLTVMFHCFRNISEIQIQDSFHNKIQILSSKKQKGNLQTEKPNTVDSEWEWVKVKLWTSSKETLSKWSTLSRRSLNISELPEKSTNVPLIFLSGFNH